MSEQTTSQTADPGFASPSAGTLLRQAREAAGLHVAALAVSMKVPVKKLEALEADRLDLLPDAVFVRALASSVCRTLKIDATPVLDRLPQTLTPRLGVHERSINTPFHASGEVRSTNLPDFLRKPVVPVVGALLVAALVVVFIPESPYLGISAEVQADTAAPAEPVMPPQAIPLPSDSAIATPGPGAEPVLQGPAVTAPVTPAPVAVPATAPAPASVVSAPMSGSASGGLLVLRSRGEAWVEVVDANGVVRVRKILGAGESTSASGPLPLSVIVGRVDATEVEIRGKAFSLDKIAKDNVARFEVK